MSHKTALASLLVCLLSVSAIAQTAPATQAKINIIIDRETIRFAPQELALEMRLVVTDQTGAEIHDSGPLSVSTLDWFMRDSKGGDLKGGLYLYTLTIKDVAGETRQRRGYLILNRTGDADRVYIATSDKVGIGTGNEAPQVTVVGSPDVTIGGAALPAIALPTTFVASGRSLSELSQRTSLQRDLQGRSSTAAAKLGGAQQHLRLAPDATPGRLAKFAADGVTPVDTQVSEANGALVVGNAGATGNIQIFGPATGDVFAGMGPDVVNGPAFNYGYAGGSFGRSAGFFNVRPDASATAPNPSLRFATANVQRMIITNTGRVGIGTTNPTDILHIEGAGTAIKTSDGAVATRLFSAAGINNKGYVGTVTNHPLVLRTNDADRVTIDTSGRVGIGTTIPVTMLHVFSSGPVSSIRGENNDGAGTGVTGYNTAGTAVAGYTTNGTAIFASGGTLGTGVYASSSSGHGVYASSSGGYGVYGASFSNIGVFGSSNDGYGVYSSSINSTGVYSQSTSGLGVFGSSTSNYGILGTTAEHERAGVRGENTDGGHGVEGVSTGSLAAIHALNTGTGDGIVAFAKSLGIFASASNSDGTGIVGTTGGSAGKGVWGSDGTAEGTSATAYAGYFSGRVYVKGMITKAGGGFKIDHPLDPENKYLTHSFVESPDMKNIYDGVAVLNENGEAGVDLPDWFGALNRDFRYQLTALGAPGPNLYVAEEVANNHFKIAGGTPGMKVSWQLTGIRQDRFANTNRLQVEEEKSEKERGSFLHPTLYGQPAEKSLEWANNPELMQQIKAQPDKAQQEKLKKSNQ